MKTEDPPYIGTAGIPGTSDPILAKHYFGPQLYFEVSCLTKYPLMFSNGLDVVR